MAYSQKGVLKNTNKYDCLSHNHLDYLGEYRIWEAMHSRCSREKSPMYKYYGGRGIKVCDRWSGENGFINFYRDMGRRPYDSMGRAFQIDRKDTDKNYCPENCRWVPLEKNARNRRSNKKILINGESFCITEACKLFNIKRTTVTEQARLGRKSLVDAFADALERRYQNVCS